MRALAALVIFLASASACGGQVAQDRPEVDAPEDAGSTGSNSHDGGSELDATAGDSHDSGFELDATADAIQPGACDNVENLPVKATALVSGQLGVTSLAVGSDEVVFTVSGAFSALKKVPASGGVPSTLAKGSGSSTGATLSGQSAYFLDKSAGIRRVAIDGSSEEMVVPDPLVTAFAVAQGFIYWADAATLRRAPLAGGAGNDIAPIQDPVVSLAIDATHAYWIERSPKVDAIDKYHFSMGKLVRAPIGGGKRDVLSPELTTPRRVAIGADGIYTSSGGTFTEAGWENEGTVWKRAFDGMLTCLSCKRANPTAIALDPSHVYWIENGTGIVSRVPANVGFTQVLAQTGAQPDDVGSIAVEAGFIYWTDFAAGVIWRASKP